VAWRKLLSASKWKEEEEDEALALAQVRKQALAQIGFNNSCPQWAVFRLCWLWVVLVIEIGM